MSLRIVLAEDDTSREVLAELLREDGYEVMVAADGAEALARIRETEPDLLITDLRMPKLDGLELIRRLNPKLPVIVVSAFLPKEDAARDAGASAFFAKPLDYKRFIEAIKGFAERLAPMPDVSGAS